MSNFGERSQQGPASTETASSGVFLHLRDLIAHFGRTTPERNAILAPGRAPLTYGALSDVVNNVTRELRHLGLGPTDRVAVALPGGADTAVAVLAVAAAASCVPLNPNLTAEELRRYLADLQISALLTRVDIDSPSRGAAHVLGVPVIDILPQPGKALWPLKLCGSEIRATNRDVMDDLNRDAFVLMTSGTTSYPRMVPLTQASVCRSAYNVGAALQLGCDDRLLSVLPLFHAHGLISGLLAAMAAGSTVACVPDFNSVAFFDWLSEFRPTWYTAVPSIHRALLLEAARRNWIPQQRSLRIVRSASASLPVAVLRDLERLFEVPVIDTYGMTEAASQIAANPLERRKPGSVGKSAGAEIAIMDRRGRRLRFGKRGEIALRGPTITRGYDNDIAATKAAFRNGWFLTGDLGYLDKEGYLFIVGRIKEVIKRGGQQVALAEIEEALLRHPEVIEAAAFAIPHKRFGEDLAAAVVLRADAAVTPQMLRDFACEHLARFKIPGLIRVVQDIPKSHSGKIRRSELAAALSITHSNTRANEIVPPRSDLERQLAKMWIELLELDQIGINQDVFALGADSLTVTQMLSRLRIQFGVDLVFKDIFAATTIADLAARIESADNSPNPSLSPPDTPADRCYAPLSYQQQRIHVLSRLDPTGYNYHTLEVARLFGPLDPDALGASIATICDRHEVLRTTFIMRSDEPFQFVGDDRPKLQRLNVQPCAKISRAAVVQRWAHESLRRSFDPEREPSLRALLLKLDRDDHALVITLHHLITDGWSQRMFWKELKALYEASAKGISIGLPELPIQYRHFVEWQRAWLGTRAAQEQLRYWRAQLKDLTELPLQTDRTRPEVWTGRGARHPLKFSRKLSRAIKSLSREHHVTLFMTLLAAFQCLLFRYTHHEDVAVGSVIANRNQVQIENLMGMFANTVVLRTDLSGDPSFSALLDRVRDLTLDAYRNQDLPFEEILRVLQMPRRMDRNNLFQVMFMLQTPALRASTFDQLSVRPVNVDPGIARVDLLLELTDADDCLSGWFEYCTDLFNSTTIARMASHLQTLLAAVVINPEERISRLPLLSERERRQVLFDWNATETRFPGPHNFFERFARHVKRTPARTAVSAGSYRLSYQQLERRSSIVADRIVRLGLSPNVIVVLLAERSVDFLAAMIAVQRAGGAFLPLDPNIPPARLAKIIRQSRAGLVLAGDGQTGLLQKALSEAPDVVRPQVLRLTQIVKDRGQNPAPPVRRAESSLGYVIFTSGSTGVPKGAIIEHRGLTNHLFSRIAELGLTASDVIAQTAPQSFDISVWQFLSALIVGARVHIFADDEVQDPVRLAKTVSREGVTVLQITPSLLRAILDRVPSESVLCVLSRLRHLVCIGEPLTPDLCRSWLRLFPSVPLINAYGPAECSDTVATHRIATELPASLATVPIGRPIANMRLYVLDDHMQPSPIGVEGELYVGGVGVGCGYLNDPEQTRRRFLPDPFSTGRRARLYRTGDLARWRADGTLEFVGRIDHQVKFRGYRIELEEIERVLAEHPDVEAAVVLMRNLGDEPRLIAYIVAAQRLERQINELRNFLKCNLPEYMIPAGFIFLNRMPLTTHGKINRSTVGAIRRGIKVASGEFTAPRDTTETILAKIWADLLAIENLGIFDNFFDLGGHSLLASRMLARIADSFEISLPLRALFEAPTIAALAQRINATRGTFLHEPIEIADVPGEGFQPISLVQEQVLKTERELPGLPQFNLSFAYRMHGTLNVSALERSFIEVMRRHDSLRTKFAWVDDLPLADVVSPDDIDSPLVVEDLVGQVPAGRRAKALLLKKATLKAEQEAWTPLDVRRAPLWRARLLRIDENDHILLLILHHIIVDGWSIGVLMEELSELYSAFISNRRAHLPKPTMQFADFARWQRQWFMSGAASRKVDYWRERLRGASPAFRVAGDLRGALLVSDTAYEPLHVSSELVERLKALSRHRGVTLFMTLLAGFKTLLWARSRRTDLCVATAMANRSQLRTERLIGPLMNTVVIRSRIDADVPFHEALCRVRDSVLEAHAHQELPFDIVAARLSGETGLDPASFTQAFFVLQNAFRPLDLPGVTVRSFAYPDGHRVLSLDRTWLSVTLRETSSGLTGACTYKTDLFEPNNIRGWMSDYLAILTNAIENPEISLNHLSNRIDG